MEHRWDLSNMVGKALLQLHGKRTPGSQALLHVILITQLKGGPVCLKQAFSVYKTNRVPLRTCLSIKHTPGVAAPVHGVDFGEMTSECASRSHLDPPH